MGLDMQLEKRKALVIVAAGGIGHPVGARWQNQGTPSDDDTVVLADNANWANNHPVWAGCTSDAYKRLRAVSCPSEIIDQIGG